MSKDYCGFSNEDGETAFLAGVVDVLSDNLSMILDNTNALDADIFLVVDNNILIPQNSKRIFHSKEGTNPAVTATK